MNLQWFKFKLCHRNIRSIEPYTFTASKSWRDTISTGNVGLFVCTIDELRAFMIITRWLELGKPLHKDEETESEFWRYDKEQADADAKEA